MSYILESKEYETKRHILQLKARQSKDKGRIIFSLFVFSLSGSVLVVFFFMILLGLRTLNHTFQ